MHFTTAAAIALAAFASSAYAHMEMSNPLPFRSKLNKSLQNQDFSMTSPLKPDGSDFPCKGYLSDLGTPAGAPTATWAPGSAQKLGISGNADHLGGSCQLSLSYDGGKTFKVIKSIEGGCVKVGGGDHTFDFTVPADAKGGDAVFAWTWFNNTGNREMYMNCAAVTISGSGTNDLGTNPNIFVGNIGKASDGCTAPGTDLEFPNKGEDVQVNPGAKLAPPTKCEDGAAGPGPAAGPPPAAGSSAAAPPPAAGSSGAPSPSSGAPSPSSGAPSPSSAAPPSASSSKVPATGAPKEAPAPAGGSGTYTVKSGDICDTIAAKNKMTVAQLREKNPKINAACTNLAVGQSITLRRRSRIMRDYY